MDDLFARAEPQPLTVSQVNARARTLLERTLGVVTVMGEVSGHKVVSGHHYFCLKDRESQLNAVLFRREAQASKVELVDGVEVLGTGRLTIYSQYGRYQLVLDRVERRGAGALQAAFEALKERLAAEGLFAAERKRKLPLVPRRVAVVTSPTGAVIRDIVNVATRRWPGASLLVVPTRVQGAESAPSVAAAVKRISSLAPRLGIDVVVVARGGGSLEDLWCFNDERVARAIHACAVPVVSAVGHETDYTIADFVADVRAPTPSAAAEIIFPVRSELAALVAQRLERGRTALARALSQRRMHLRALKAELGDSRRLLRDGVQRLAQLRLEHEQALRELVHGRRRALGQLDARLLRLHPRARLAKVRGALDAAERRSLLAARQAIAGRRERLTAAVAHLAALSPLAVLERGYAIVQTVDGAVVRRHGDVSPGTPIAVRLAEGRLAATVDATSPPEDPLDPGRHEP